MNGQHQDFHFWQTGANQLGRHDSIKFGHVHIHEDEIGFQLHRTIEGLTPICRFPDHAQVRLMIEEEAETLIQRLLRGSTW